MGLSLLSSICLLAVFLQSRVECRMLPILQSNDVENAFPSLPSPQSRSVIRHWNSSSHRVDQTFGATWAFAINAMGAERLDIDFAVANLTEDTPCVKCSALRISFRFDEGHIVLNSRRNGKWDFEERLRTPVERDDDFNLMVKLVNDGFEISIDSYWHAKYYSRLRSSQISDVRSFGGEQSLVVLSYSEEEAPQGDQEVVGQLHKSKRALREYESLLDEYRNSYNKLLSQYSQLQKERHEESPSGDGHEIDENRVQPDYETTEDQESNDDDHQDEHTRDTDYQETDENQIHDDAENQDQHVEGDQDQGDDDHHEDETEDEETDHEENHTSDTHDEDYEESEESSHEDPEYDESAEEDEESNETEDEEGTDSGENLSLETLEQEYKDAMKRYMNAKVERAFAQIDM